MFEDSKMEREALTQRPHHLKFVEQVVLDECLVVVMRKVGPTFHLIGDGIKAVAGPVARCRGFRSSNCPCPTEEPATCGGLLSFTRGRLACRKLNNTVGGAKPVEVKRLGQFILSIGEDVK